MRLPNAGALGGLDGSCIYRQGPLAAELVSGRSWNYIKFARLHIRSPSWETVSITRSPSCEHALIIFSGRGWDYIKFARLYIGSPSWETVSIISRAGARMVCSCFCVQAATRSHSCEHTSIIFFGPELERNRTRETSVAFFLSTTERRLAADRSNQIFLCARLRMGRHLRCRASAHSSNFGTSSRSSYERACRLEVFASIFLCCLVLHGLY